MSRQLAGLVAPSTSTGGLMGGVTGVEPNARLRTLAASRAQDHGVPNVSFVDGLAGALPFEDSSVDLVWCERVLQHLNDPHAATDDVARILRPGGRAILLDADQGTRIISDLYPDVAAAFVSASLAAVANRMLLDAFPRRSAGLDSHWTRTWVRLLSSSRPKCCYAAKWCSGRRKTPSNREVWLAMSPRRPCARCTPPPSAARRLRPLPSLAS